MYWKKALLGAIMTVTTAVIPAMVYGQAYGSVATQTLNVREGARTDRAIVEQLDYKAPVEIVEEVDGWVKVILANDERGFVKADYLSIHRAVATVTADALRVRDYPDKNNSKVLGNFSEGEEISLHFKVGDWYKISQEGFEGFVHQDYVKSDYLKYLPTKKISDVKRYKLTRDEAQNQTVKVIETTGKTETATSPKTEKPSSNKAAATNKSAQASTGSKGQQIVEDAKNFIGNPYVYGGNSLTSGVDCSGFTQQIMARHGISISRSSSAQYANNGYSVSSDQLQPGDLTFYGYNGKVSHVAIYMGNGKIVHANDERTGITTSNVFPGGGKPYIGARRVVN
ncbi:MAG: NlpC/P60 family protein [Cellulosilyticaceae bacterium]